MATADVDQSHAETIMRHSGSISGTVGNLLRIERTHGGLVSHVYRIVGESGEAYAKIRGDRFSALPDIRTEPSEIAYESRAMGLLSAVLPEVFPKQLAFDAKGAMIIMSDVMRGGASLESRLRKGGLDGWQATKLGALLARVHLSLKCLGTAIREDGDEEYYARNLQHRLGFRPDRNLYLLVDQMKKLPRQLILGDLSPKNVCISSSGSIAVCDLEGVHMGNPIFDLGFLAAHLIVHNLGRPGLAEELVQGLLGGYSFVSGDIETCSPMLKRIALGIILYRLDNKVIPYRVDASDEAKAGAAKAAVSMLLKYPPTWHEIIGAVAMGADGQKGSVIEREVKVLNVDEAEIAGKLEGLGARKILDAVTYIESFDFASYERHDGPDIPQRFRALVNALEGLKAKGMPMLMQGAYLRLRQEGERCEALLKVPLGGGAVGYKEETEIGVEIKRTDWDETRRFLERMGLKRVAVQEKKRVSYSYPQLGLRFDIDTWPGIPTYLEIEGRDMEGIRKGLGMLGFAEKDSTAMQAGELFRRYGVDASNLTFKGRAGAR